MPEPTAPEHVWLNADYAQHCASEATCPSPRVEYIRADLALVVLTPIEPFDCPVDAATLEARALCDRYGLHTEVYTRGGGEHPFIAHIAPALRAKDAEIAALKLDILKAAEQHITDAAEITRMSATFKAMTARSP